MDFFTLTLKQFVSKTKVCYRNVDNQIIISFLFLILSIIFHQYLISFNIGLLFFILITFFFDIWIFKGFFNGKIGFAIYLLANLFAGIVMNLLNMIASFYSDGHIFTIYLTLFFIVSCVGFYFYFLLARGIISFFHIWRSEYRCLLQWPEEKRSFADTFKYLLSLPPQFSKKFSIPRGLFFIGIICATLEGCGLSSILVRPGGFSPTLSILPEENLKILYETVFPAKYSFDMIIASEILFMLFSILLPIWGIILVLISSKLRYYIRSKARISLVSCLGNA